MKKLLLAEVTCVLLSGTALCETNVCTETAMTSLLNSISHIRRQDNDGLNVYQSERDVEIKKFNLDSLSNDKTGVALSSTTSNLLLSLPLLPASPTAIQENQSTENADVRRQLAKEHVIPLWIDNKWTDGAPLAVNGFSISPTIVSKLAELNYLEHLVGTHVAPERKHQASLGGARPKILSLRYSINQAGYRVEFDKTFGIWRITGTNAPVARSP